jgi:hypothetical protein
MCPTWFHFLIIFSVSLETMSQVCFPASCSQVFVMLILIFSSSRVNFKYYWIFLYSLILLVSPLDILFQDVISLYHLTFFMEDMISDSLARMSKRFITFLFCFTMVIIFRRLFFEIRSNFIYLCIYLLFIYSHVHTLFGSFLPPALPPPSLPPPPSIPGRTCSALFYSSVED